ncbi:multiple epidermal growth factor-like domains protein 9 [Astyanax mexicanus]|uniref:multiple epidermal growth factor-like domains protein 9 n=1 Tax=Astyanax mexicanus TaxID=7994 RepID=UPI0020CB234D|nr:multiple epidermal growth factor-like domains protein 9 [Astyanax mexicanus]
MVFVLYGMSLFPVLLLLFGRTAASVQENDFTVAAVENRPEPPLSGGTTTIPNYLPEDEPKLPLFTPAPFFTTKESRTAGKAPRLLPSASDPTPAAALTQTTARTTANHLNSRLTDQTTASRELLTSAKTATFTPYPPKNSTTAAVQDTTTTFTTTTTPNIPTTKSWSMESTSTATSTTEKGPQCNCSVEGTLDPLSCDPGTGQCVCVQGYSGLQCDGCEDEYFNNGTSGCQPCGCDTYGALGKRCDGSGVCTCKMGVYGDKCDDCRPGFFKFSSTGCQPCQCNNHTSLCDTQSGICLNCQGNTKGPSCEECKYNFYRPPGTAATEACLPCPCSSVTSTGSCTLDQTGQPVCDQCNREYQGPNCEQCRDGFYNADSICVPCNCSGNEDPHSRPRVCHPDTGHCLNCQHNTAGTHCERCAQGFTGDALSKNCTAIVFTTRPPPTTMTPSPNGTEQLPTLSSALITSLASPTTNGTSATAADVSWAQFNVIVLAVIIVVLVVLMGVAGGVYTYREYQNRKLNAPFWTIELKEDNISFSSYHDSIPNADVSGLLEDEMSEVASNGQLTLSSPGNLFKA